MASLDRSSIGASTSRAAAPCFPRRVHLQSAQRCQSSPEQCRRPFNNNLTSLKVCFAAGVADRGVPRGQTVIPRSSSGSRQPFKLPEEYLPIYVALDKNVLTTDNVIHYDEALRAGLRSLRALGVKGVFVDVWWGIVESKEPKEYNWSGYRKLFRMIQETGLNIKVGLSFHSSSLAIPLPAWVIEEGRSNPDIFYTDKAGGRCGECITLGIDDLPVLRSRTGLEIYEDFMESFKAEFQHLFGSSITECLIGLGPNGELKYPSHPTLDKRWTFPGVGEFQCYDRFMIATLKACAEQVVQPSWGLGGPHDAGSYCMWPHQTGFFHQNGNWSSPYGKFFLQWYSEMLSRHADSVLAVSKQVFRSCPLPLAVRMPAAHWWFNTASHAPELTCGYYNTANREGYLPMFKVLARHGVTCYLGLADMRSYEHSNQAFCDPDKLLIQQRTVAAALGVPVAFENVSPRFEEGMLGRIEALIFDSASNQGIDLPMARSLNFQAMSEDMFEPANWRSFKSFTSRFQQQVESCMDIITNSHARSISSMDVPIMPENGNRQSGSTQSISRPAYAK